MSQRALFHGLATALLLSAAVPALAGNTLIAKDQKVAVAKSLLTVSASREWNKMGARPGRNSETWTLDGDKLNDLTFYGGIADGATMFREVDKRNRPLPRFSASMLITDVPTLLENSYRIALATPLMKIDTIEPTSFAGRNGVRFTYSFAEQDQLQRKGEAYAAIVGGRLFMITFEAPVLYYFDAGIEAARAVTASARLP